MAPHVMRVVSLLGVALGALVLLGVSCEPHADQLLVHTEGAGLVDGLGISCREGAARGSGDCTAPVTGGDVVLLEAIADEGARFSHWAESSSAVFPGEDRGRSCAHTDPNCSFTHDGAGSVSVWAYFELRVDCDHEGAGDPITIDGIDGCLCLPNTFQSDDLSGRWNERYNCLQGSSCVDVDTLTAFDLVMTGPWMTATSTDGDWSVSGFVCDDLFDWSGGAPEIGYTETGAWSFRRQRDDAGVLHNMFDKVSHYQHTEGAYEGDCVGVGVPDPEVPPAIEAPLCTE